MTLHQRYLYPVDKTRANEYGIAYEHAPGAAAAADEVATLELCGDGGGDGGAGNGGDGGGGSVDLYGITSRDSSLRSGS